MSDKHDATALKIAAVLREQLEATEVTVENQSHLHAGHAGAREGGHFFVVVKSPRFAGLAPLARQRLVYSAMGEMMDGAIHALSMRCLWP